MPVVALGFSVAPVAGQNFGARKADRVKATFKDATAMAAAYMFVLAIVTHIAPESQVGVFSKDPQAIAIGAEYLRVISWNYVASGLIFVASSMFQAMGNTMPSLFASATRITLIAIPAVLLSRLPTFQLHWIWYLSVASVFIQLTVSLLLLRREFRKRMTCDLTPAASAPELAPSASLSAS